MPKSLEDLIEPGSENEEKFNLSVKQLQFIQNDNNVKLINNIMQSMKKYKLEIDDINNIVEKHLINEQKRIERNEARKIKKQQEQNNQNNSSSEDEAKSILSNKSNNKTNRKKEAIQEKGIINRFLD